jgi:hypothetical protein
MNGLMLYDGYRHMFVPLGIYEHASSAIANLSSSMLQRIAAAGQEPQHDGAVKLPPDCNNAPTMRLVHAELERREHQAEARDRAADTAVSVHQSRRWVGPALSNYGRTA